ncbi:unnamed protein product, partial [Hapterophycus canaliculatus]
RNLFKFYIVEEGEARAYVQEDGEEVLMSHLRPGDHFGEKALVERTPRTATVKAHGPLKCAALSIAGFERLMVSENERGSRSRDSWNMSSSAIPRVWYHVW